MTLTPYKEPPIIKLWAVHGIGTAMLGAILPSGALLQELHSYMLPVVQLFPNAIAITSLAPNPMFAQTFIGLSLLCALALVLYFLFFMHGYHTRTFETRSKRYFLLASAWGLAAFCLLVSWYLPYLDPLSKGRVYFMIKAAISGEIGVLTAMNQLVVGLPMIMLFLPLLGHVCTTVIQRKSSI